MKHLFYLFGLFLIILPGYAQEDYSETKAQINKIKKNSAYLYGEATLSSSEEALALAKEILEKEIDAWVEEREKLSSSNHVVIKNINKVSEQMTLPRGNMYRAFVYVKKSDIIPSENVTIKDNNTRNITTAGNQQTTAPQNNNNNQPTTNPVLASILKLSNFSQLKDCLTTLKQEGKISSYDKYASLANPADYYLIIYNRQGQIEAILSPGQDSRINIKTNQPDDITNYKGRGAIGFKL